MIKIAVFKGRVVTTPAFGELAITENCYVGVNGSGVIEFVDDDFDRVSRQYPEYFQSQAVLVDLGEKFMVAGFVDCHCHGAQYGNAGTGTDLPLLQWLETYTFPTEQRFASLDVAREVYTKCARSTLRNGTTTCSYFATIHADATMLFADILATVGQRAFVGKVCMDRNSPSTYVETCEQSLLDTKRVVEHVNALADRRVYPVVTPRFVPSCSSTLMRGLGAIAREHCTLIQSHVSENRSEVEWVAALHKDADSYVQCYDAHDLLTSRTILAHGVYLTDDEIQLLKLRGTAIIHCPNSNFTIRSGVCNVRRLIAAGVKVALGTDVSGGTSSSMFDAMRSAIVASTVIHFANDQMPPLTFKEALYLATVSGANALGLGDKIGSLTVGKEFDAVILDAHVAGAVDAFANQSLHDTLSKLVFTGDDRNVAQVFVGGCRVKSV